MEKILDKLIEPNLTEILLYKNDYVVETFMRDYNLKKDEAYEIFNETLKWLWLCAHNRYESWVLKSDKTLEVLPITDSTLIIDEMWHTFILCTSDYYLFCEKYFGYLIHHFPTSKTQKDSFDNEYKSNKSEYLKRIEAECHEIISFVYDKLGHETVELWYITYMTKYSKENIKSIFIKNKY